MAVTVIVRWTGFASGEDALALYDRRHPLHLRLARESGGMRSHTCAATADGLVMVDVWDDAEAWGRYLADPRAVADFATMDLPAAPTMEVLPLHEVVGIGS